MSTILPLKWLLMVSLVTVCAIGCRTTDKPQPLHAPSKGFSKHKAPVGVSNAPAKERVPAPIPAPAPASVNAARLRPGLVITVTVLVSGKKEIESTGKRVTDKETIAMPLLGTVGVKDLTLDELGALLTSAYREYFINPQVIVEFVRDDNKEGLSPWGSVTVLGRVKKPGKISIPATRDLTVSAAIQQAGGFDTSAKETAIRVTHRLADGTMKIREVDLHSVGAQGIMKDDLLLEQDDVVFVPEWVF